MIAFVVSALAACSLDTDRPVAPTSANGASEASGSLRPEGRILFLRETESFVSRADGSGEQPFLPGKEIAIRSVSPDGTQLAFIAANAEGMIVGGTVDTHGNNLRLFDSPDTSLNLACGWWGPDDRIDVRRMG